MADVRHMDAPSDAVSLLQAALAVQGHPLPRSRAEDGRYDGCAGDETWAAVDAWCIAAGVEWDAQRRVLSDGLIDRIVATAHALGIAAMDAAPPPKTPKKAR